MAGNFPDELRYSESDEWVRRDGDDVTVGITDYASEQLGDVVYLQLPSTGASFTKGETFGEIESVKAVSDLRLPVSGVITATNSDLEDNPGLVNEDPYGRGWIVKLRLSDPKEYDSLLDAATYELSTAERN